jgi:hypothetical protein
MTGTLISIRKGDILLVQQENSRRLPAMVVPVRQTVAAADGYVLTARCCKNSCADTAGAFFGDSVASVNTRRLLYER